MTYESVPVEMWGLSSVAQWFRASESLVDGHMFRPNLKQTHSLSSLYLLGLILAAIQRMFAILSLVAVALESCLSNSAKTRMTDTEPFARSVCCAERCIQPFQKAFASLGSVRKLSILRPAALAHSHPSPLRRKTVTIAAVSILAPWRPRSGARSSVCIACTTQTTPRLRADGRFCTENTRGISDR